MEAYTIGWTQGGHIYTPANHVGSHCHDGCQALTFIILGMRPTSTLLARLFGDPTTGGEPGHLLPPVQHLEATFRGTICPSGHLLTGGLCSMGPDQ